MSRTELAALRAENATLLRELALARQTGQRHRALFDAANDAILIADADSGLLVDANNCAERLLGLPRERIVGMHQAQLHPLEDQVDDRRRFQEQVAAGAGVARGVRVVHVPTGECVPVEVSGSLVVDGGRRLLIGIFRDVRERHRLEHALAASDHLLHAVIDALPVAVAFYDLGLRHRLLNAQGAALRPQPAQTWIGRPAREALATFLEPAQADALVAEYREVLATGGVVRHHARPLVHGDGRTRWWDVTLLRVDDRDGRPLGLLVAKVDVTTHVEARLAVAASEAQYRAMGESVEYGNWLTGPAGDVRFLGPAMRALIGMADDDPVDAVRGHFVRALPDEDWRRLEAAWARSLATGGALESEFRVRAPDGDLRHVLARGRPVRGADGAIVAWAGINLDVTERKRLEERLSAALAAARLGTWHWDAATGAVEWDAALRAVVGLGPHDPVPSGERFAEWIHPDDRGGVAAAFAAACAGIADYDVEFRLRHADGTWHWHRSRGRAAFAAGRATAMTGACVDVTDRREAEDAIRRQAEALAASNAELERYAYLAAHDLQEPLRNVTSYLSLLEKRCAPAFDARGREWMAYVMAAAARMRGMIQALLSYSLVGRQEIEAAALPLDGPLADALAALAGAADGADIRAGPLPHVHGDRVLLALVFQNLIGNALKFRHPERPPRVRLTARDAGAQWEIAVEDDGIGIDPEDGPKLFQLFQRLHPSDRYPGTGLGLASCKRIVERHGGRIGLARPSSGVGTRVVFTLPKAAEG